MTKYIAFLRGINVSGQKLIKMEDLSRMFVEFGFENVKTYIQSGNVIFESAEVNPEAVTQKVEKGLLEALGYEVTVMLRMFLSMEELVRRDPFKGVKADGDAKMYVTFLRADPKSEPKLPLISSKKEIEVFRIENRDVFSLAFPLDNGRSSFPNAFIEKELGVAATTRNWTTVSKIVK